MNSITIHGAATNGSYSVYNGRTQLGGATKKKATKKATKKSGAKTASKPVAPKGLVKGLGVNLAVNTAPVVEPTAALQSVTVQPVVVEDPLAKVNTILTELNAKLTPVKCVATVLEEGVSMMISSAAAVPTINKTNLEILGDLCKLTPGNDICKDERYKPGCSLVETNDPNRRQLKCNGHFMGGTTDIIDNNNLTFNFGKASAEDIKAGTPLVNACFANRDGRMFCTYDVDVRKHGLYAGPKPVREVGVSDKLIDDCKKTENANSTVCKAIEPRVTSGCVVEPMNASKWLPVRCNGVHINSGGNTNKMFERKEGNVSKEICLQNASGVQCVQADKYGLYGRNGLRWVKRDAQALNGMALIAG